MTAAQRNRDFTMSVDRKSLTKLQRTIQRLPAAMEKKVIKPALKEGQKQVVLPRAKGYIHANRHDIDRLADFLQVRSLPRQSGNRKGVYGSVVQFKAGSDSELAISDKNEKRWWKPSFFEYGAPSTKKGGGDRTGNGRSYGRIPGFSFMRRALYGHESEVKHVVGAESKRRLTAAVLTLARMTK